MKSFIHSAAWRATVKALKSDRDDLVEKLVTQRGHDESMVTRGQIIQIDNILERYPTELGGDTNEENDV